MSTGKKKKYTWIQCATCGKIHQLPRLVPVEELYVAAYCPECESEIGINLGDDEDEIYNYYNINLDSRCYNY